MDINKETIITTEKYIHVKHGSEKLFVCLHGYTSNKEELYNLFSDFFRDEKYDFLIIDAPFNDEITGNGKQWFSLVENPESVKTDEQLDLYKLNLDNMDAKYCYNQISRSGLDNVLNNQLFNDITKQYNEINLFGFSQGASVVLYWYLKNVDSRINSYVTISCPYFSGMENIKNSSQKDNIIVINLQKDTILGKYSASKSGLPLNNKVILECDNYPIPDIGHIPNKETITKIHMIITTFLQNLELEKINQAKKYIYSSDPSIIK